MTIPPAPRRMLVVEDTFLIGMQLKEDLETAGWSVSGPCPTVERALDALNAARPDGAVLDVNLGQEDSLPVARRLQELGIPFLFITGYEHADVETTEFSTSPLMKKPVPVDDLLDALENIF